MREAIEATERVITAAQELKRSLMKHLFTYGPVPVSDAANVPLQETEIGEFPSDWQLTTIGETFNIKLGKMLSRASKKGVSPKPYLRNANVQWGKFDLSDIAEMDFSQAEMAKYRLQKKDILVCEGGEIGRTAIWENQLDECYYQKALHRLRPKENDTLPYYFLEYMSFIFLVRKAPIVEGAKSTIAHLPVAKLKMVPLALPTIRIQKKILETTQAINTKIKVEEERKAALEALFDSLLHHLMTGKVRVPF